MPGVEVGFTTLIEGEGEHAVRTGVTAILPRGRDGVGDPCHAGIYSMNGNGELTGSHWIAETGLLHLPIGITNSHAVGPVHRGIIDWVVDQHPDRRRASGCCPASARPIDGDLNDINGAHVTAEHAVAALDAARRRPRRRGQRRRRHRHELLRLQGRHRDGVALGPATETSRTPSACCCRRTSATAHELTIRGVPVGQGHP